MLCHTMPYAFLPFVIAFPALPNGLFRLAEKPVSCRDMVRPAPPYGAIWQCGKAFFVLRRHIFPRPSTLKTPPRHPFSRSLTHISHQIRSSFPISRCQYFLLLKTYKYAFLHLLTLSPPHSLTSSLFPFYLFNFLPFYF